MTSPDELRRQARKKRADADLLRETAGQLRTKGGALDDGTREVLSHYPHQQTGVWVGPAADTFYGELTTVSTNLGTLGTDVTGYAGACERKAGALDDEADDLEAQARTLEQQATK
ncbi:hypothetical protein [Nocardioides sp. CER19]|uniref:hypothetical protein n=1 Tax=Nocardioides sp. CER19 TaxID=3038538 RepID=UPI002448CBA8|nr:hypothetical protein [Nocardioides sp. CER19]MDH2412722.1 hypothetical protein [Nocardioides sp. CER19]